MSEEGIHQVKKATVNTLGETFLGWLLYFGNILIFHITPLAINISGIFLLYFEYNTDHDCVGYSIDWCIFLVIGTGLQLLLNIRNMYLGQSYFDWIISRSHDVALFCLSVLGVIYLCLGGGSLIVYYASCRVDDNYLGNWIFISMIVLFGCGFLSLILGLSIFRYYKTTIESNWENHPE